MFKYILTTLTLISIFLPGYDLSNFEKGKIKYFFPESDSSFIQHISISLQPELENFEKIFNHKIKNKIKLFFPKTDEDYHKLTGGRLPEWSGAVAISKDRIIIIKPQKFIEYDKLLITLKHELIHIIVADKYQNARFPLWLHEGLATYLSNNYIEINEGLIISNAMASEKILELSEINQLMQFNKASANLAYLEAKVAVEYLIKHIGISNLPQFLNDLNSQSDSNEVFKKYLGYDQLDFEFYWYNYMKEKYRWMVVLNFDNLIWFVLILVMVIAFIVVKVRNYKKKKSWQMDELLENMEE